MICQKEFTITVNAALPAAQAWWTMDLGTPINETDSVAAYALTPLGGAGFMSTVAGKVNNALNYAANFGTSCVSISTDAGLRRTGNGVTLIGWMNVVNVLPDASSLTTLSYQFVQGGLTYRLNITLDVVANLWRVYWGTAPTVTTISLLAAPGWHFYACTIDLITGAVELAIDQLNFGNDIVAPPAAGVNTTGSFVTSAAAAGAIPGSTNTSIFDEAAVYNSVLTVDQLDYIYNLGTGRTYPP